MLIRDNAIENRTEKDPKISSKFIDLTATSDVT